MSEDFIRGRRIDLKSLYQLKGVIENTRLDLLNAWVEQPLLDDKDVEGQLADLIGMLKVCKLEEDKREEEMLAEEKERLDRLAGLLRRNAPQHRRARKLYGSVEAFAKRRKAKACEPPEGWQTEFDGLLTDFVRSLTELKVIKLSWDAIPYDDLVDVERLFSEEVYEYLPFEARQDFQEAGRCFLFEQHKAAVMLSFRGSERVVKEYFQRVTGQKGKEKTFEAINAALLNKPNTPLADASVLNWIHNASKKRNEFMHSSEKNEELKPSTAKSHINLATGLCSVLIDDLRDRNKLLVVAIERPIDLDQALALWLLEKRGGGIGRKELFERRHERELDMRDVSVKIGGEDEDTKKKLDGFPDCITLRMKDRLNQGEAYASFVEFAGKSRHKTGGAALVESDSPAETLEELNESLRQRHSNSPEQYLSEAWNLFDAIWNSDLRPCDPHLARSLPGEFASLTAQARQRLESTAEKSIDIEYDGEKCLLIETKELKSDGEYKQLGVPYVIIRDTTTFHVRINYFGAASPNLKPIYQELNSRRPLGFKYAQNQLLSKEPLKDLSLAQLKEIVEAAEMARVGSA